MRSLALAAVLVLASGPAARAGTDVQVRYRWPVLAESGARVYIAWPVREGARAGARVLVHRQAMTLPETLTVAWAREDVSALAKSGFAPVQPLSLPGSQDWAEPLDPVRTPRPSGTLRVPLAQLPTTLDPVRATSLPDKQVLTQVFEGLMRLGPDSGVELGLADSVGGDANGRVYRIRAGARFHDGQPVRSADVVASLQRALAPATHAPRVEELLEAIAGARAWHEGAASALAGVVALDSLHVRIVPAGAPGAVDAALASLAAAILPARQAASPGFAFVPVGTGPFRFLHADSTAVLLGAAEGRVGGIDTLVFRRVASPQDAALQFELGRLDLVFPAAEDEGRLLATGAVREQAPEWSTYYLGMNCRSGWLSSRANRRAVAAAIDRELLVSVLVPGRAELAHGLVPWRMAEPLPDSAWLPGRAEAARIPRAAPPAAGLSLWVPRTSATGLRIAEFVQATLARHGLRVRIEARPWDQFERGLAAGKADLFYLSWYADGPDARRFVEALVGAPGRGGEGNHTFYASPAVDSALAAARVAEAAAPLPEDLDRGATIGYSAAHARRIHGIEAMALADAPLLPLFHSVNVALVRPWVEGFAPDPFGCPRYETVEIVRSGTRTAEDP